MQIEFFLVHIAQVVASLGVLFWSTECDGELAQPSWRLVQDALAGMM